ncbi:MAG: spheroidene monooxygenase [Rubrivivax sp.]|nr:spheroidene monooxygenase [Rubrivivax sp.]
MEPARPALSTAAHPAAASGPAGLATPPEAATHAVIVLLRYRRRHLLWGLSRLLLAPWGLGAVPGLRGARILGSGREGGFGVWPGLRHQGLMAFFDNEASARAFACHDPAVAQRRARADRWFCSVLAVSSSRGSWNGLRLQPAGTPGAQAAGPVAVLTRASIRPTQARTFWSHSPATERALAHATGCRLAAGLGEAPLLRQATFSLWDSAAALEAYARRGEHGEAARQAWGQGWFSEWMFVRFVPLSQEGQWHDRRAG